MASENSDPATTAAEAATTTVSASAAAGPTPDSSKAQQSKKFVGFYLFLRDMQEEVDRALWQYYAKLTASLRAYQQKQIQAAASAKKSANNKKDLLIGKEEVVGELRAVQGAEDDFILFRGAYVKTFEDGGLLYKMLHLVVSVLGDTAEQLVDKQKHYKSEGKSVPSLRAAYWYIDTNFVSQLPIDYQVAFSVDCLLYGEWRVQHPNLLGLHLLVLAWMLGERQFARFLPPGMEACAPVSDPLFKQFPALAGLHEGGGGGAAESAGGSRRRSKQQPTAKGNEAASGAAGKATAASGAAGKAMASGAAGKTTAASGAAGKVAAGGTGAAEAK